MNNDLLSEKISRLSIADNNDILQNFEFDVDDYKERLKNIQRAIHKYISALEKEIEKNNFIKRYLFTIQGVSDYIDHIDDELYVRPEMSLKKEGYKESIQRTYNTIFHKLESVIKDLLTLEKLSNKVDNPDGYKEYINSFNLLKELCSSIGIYTLSPDVIERDIKNAIENFCSLPKKEQKSKTKIEIYKGGCINIDDSNSNEGIRLVSLQYYYNFPLSPLDNSSDYKELGDLIRDDGKEVIQCVMRYFSLNVSRSFLNNYNKKFTHDLIIEGNNNRDMKDMRGCNLLSYENLLSENNAYLRAFEYNVNCSLDKFVDEELRNDIKSYFDELVHGISHVNDRTEIFNRNKDNFNKFAPNLVMQNDYYSVVIPEYSKIVEFLKQVYEELINNGNDVDKEALNNILQATKDVCASFGIHTFEPEIIQQYINNPNNIDLVNYLQNKGIKFDYFSGDSLADMDIIEVPYSISIPSFGSDAEYIYSDYLISNNIVWAKHKKNKDTQSEEYIPGTNIRRPRNINPSETEEEYINYLSDYYKSVFPKNNVKH